jgi:hypothetical protein
MGEGRGTIPRFEDTGLRREDLEEAAEELGLDHEDVDDQTLLERLGVELGQLEPDQLSDPADASDEPDDDGEDGDEEDIDDPLDPEAIAEEEQEAPGAAIEGPTRDELREQLRERGLPVSGTKAELAERLADADPG